MKRSFEEVAFRSPLRAKTKMTQVLRTGDQTLGMSGGVVLTQTGPDCFRVEM